MILKEFLLLSETISDYKSFDLKNVKSQQLASLRLNDLKYSLNR